MNSSNQYYTMNMTTNISPSWQPEAVLNNKIIQDTNITSNWKYRQYIQENANQIMKYNTMESINTSGNNPYYGENTNQSFKNMPQLYNSLHSPSVTPDSDLKREYLNKQRLNARMVSPSIYTLKKLI